MKSEAEQKHDMEGESIKLTTSILFEDPRFKITPMQQVLSALIGGLITTFVGE